MKKIVFLIGLITAVIALSGCLWQPACGNGICEIFENQESCLSDCHEACIDECNQEGVTQCSGNGYQICGNFDSGLCLEWSPIIDCPAGCLDGNCIERDPGEFYQCQGRIINNLCYMDSNNAPAESYEDSEIKIYALFERNNPPNSEFDFNLFIENKTNRQKTIDYHYFVRNDVYEKISTDFLTDDDAPKRGLHLALQPNEEKKLNARFRVQDTNLLAPLLEISFWKNSSSAYIGLMFQDIACVGRNKFLTWSFSQDTLITENAICCDGVIYPSANCCSNADCERGVCIDGLCMGEERKYIFYAGQIPQSALAIGNKQVLYLSLSENYSSNTQCNFEPTAEIALFNTVESFYDNQAALLLNADSNFINFKWNLVRINPIDFNITMTQSGDPISVLNIIIDGCNFNPENYDLIVLEEDPQYAAGWCPGPGCASGKYLYLVSIMSNEQNPAMGNTLTHEINHFFGASDYYILIGTRYQWDGALQGLNSQLRNSNPNLQLVRAEIGWADLDSDGITDAIEDQE